MLKQCHMIVANVTITIGFGDDIKIISQCKDQRYTYCSSSVLFATNATDIMLFMTTTKIPHYCPIASQCRQFSHSLS